MYTIKKKIQSSKQIEKPNATTELHSPHYNDDEHSSRQMDRQAKPSTSIQSNQITIWQSAYEYGRKQMDRHKWQSITLGDTIFTHRRSSLP